MDLIDDPYFSKWVQGYNKGTKGVYMAAQLHYVEYTGMTPTELIEEAVADQNEDPLNRTGIGTLNTDAFSFSPPSFDKSSR